MQNYVFSGSKFNHCRLYDFLSGSYSSLPDILNTLMNLRPILFLYALTIGSIAGVVEAKDHEPELPALRKEVSKVESIVPAGWMILAQVSGDLNGDKKDDHVVILTATDNQNDDVNFQRILIVLLDEGGVLKVNAVSQKSVKPKDTGGIWGDPFESIKIERGTFLVSHYAGSRNRWGYRHRYRYQDDGWYLIGRTEYSYDKLSPESEEKDENLLTGRVIETMVDETGKETRTDQKLKLHPLIPLGTGEFDEDGYLELP